MDGKFEAQGLRPTAQDSQLDRELESAFGIEPSPEFLARVRMRIAAASAPPVESGFSRIRRLAFEPLAALAVVGIVLIAVVPRFTGDGAVVQRPGRATVTQMARKAEMPGASVEADLPVGLTIKTRSLRQRPMGQDRIESPRTLPLQLSPVMFSEEDQRAFALFVTAVGEGRVPEEVVKRSDESSVETALSIEPLAIAPLPPLARVAQEGEGQWE